MGSDPFSAEEKPLNRYRGNYLSHLTPKVAAAARVVAAEARAGAAEARVVVAARVVAAVGIQSAPRKKPAE